MQSKRYTTVLTIAGFDGSGGAGMQADCKTFMAFGCYGLSVLTSLPVQNTTGVKKVYSLPRECIQDQLQSIFDDVEVDAIKIGMLEDIAVIDIVANAIEKRQCPIVLDPVLVAKSGHYLLKPEAILHLQKRLFPLVTVITPNLPETSALLQRTVSKREEMEEAALELTQKGVHAALVKGGHLQDPDSADCLCLDKSFYWMSAQRISTPNTHGTGCTLSAAIAAELALGTDLIEAVSQAKQYLTSCIQIGAEYRLGHGHGPVHHFHHIHQFSR